MKTCLVIDDVTVTRFAAKSFLEELGVNIVEAKDKEEALSELQNSIPDVILLDWHLKKESGIDLLKIIREKHGNDLKVVIFSGVEESNKAAEARAAGANGFISKPTTKAKIERELKSVGII